MEINKKDKKIKVRKARINGIEAITIMYNYAVVNTVATFDTEPKTVDS